MATLTVRGRGVVHGKPDEISIGFVASGYGDDPAAAYAQAAQRARDLERTLDELGIPAEARRTASIFAHEVEEIPGRQAPGRFVASSRTAVKLDDAAVVERVLLDAAQAEIAFEGPTFALSGNNPAWLDACARAADDARRRAEAYASALGLPLVALLGAAEPGTGAQVAHVASFGPTLVDSGMPIYGGADATAVLDVTYELGAA
ncbi:MAG TPA: SIMPL domain-containing protein [Gaiellaceae bacterium]